MNIKRLPIRLRIPAGHYVEQASALQCSRSLRERLAEASVVVALWPTGAQEVVWGRELLMRLGAGGQSRVKVLLLRVADDEDYASLNRTAHLCKDPGGVRTKSLMDKVTEKTAPVESSAPVHPFSKGRSWRTS